MRKIKRFSLTPSQILSENEMTQLCGMEFIPYSCSYEGQKCVYAVTGGVNTGTCKWVYQSPTKQELTCVVD